MMMMKMMMMVVVVVLSLQLAVSVHAITPSSSSSFSTPSQRLQAYATAPPTQANFTQVEFVFLFNTTSVNGTNHGYATNQVQETVVTRDGVQGTTYSMTPGTGNIPTIEFVSTPTPGPNNTFTNTGQINFLQNSLGSIQFASTGSGGVSSTVPDADGQNITFGSIQYEILSGEGVFETATGAMCDVFVAHSANDWFTVEVLGVMWVSLPQGLEGEKGLQQQKQQQRNQQQPQQQQAHSINSMSGSGQSDFALDIFSLDFVTIGVDSVNHGKAQTQSIATTVTKDGLSSVSTQTSNTSSSTALYHSVTASPAPNSFVERGNISTSTAYFNFASTGSGGQVSSYQNITYGSIQYNIVAGEGAGAYAQAVGPMADVFVALPNSNTFNIYTIGALLIPNATATVV